MRIKSSIVVAFLVGTFAACGGGDKQGSSTFDAAAGQQPFPEPVYASRQTIGQTDQGTQDGLYFFNPNRFPGQIGTSSVNLH